MELKELREQTVALVPAREALGKFTWADVDAYNKAVALNVYSTDSDAAALAAQHIDVG